MWFGIVSLFPEIFEALTMGVVNKALEKKLVTIECFNPRDFAQDKHKSVDDKPYGGGPGMVMMGEPLKAALSAAKKAAKVTPYTIYLSPQGKKFTQKEAALFAEKEAVIMLAGRYEGIDERIIEQEVDAEWSIGDYILTGGELPALVIVDAVARLLPGVVGDEASINEDSITTGLLKYPQYTRPENLGEHGVPTVLLSGNHQAIKAWRTKQSLGRTWQKRPDMLLKRKLSSEESQLLQEFISENKLEK